MGLTAAVIQGVAGVTSWGIATTDAQLKVTGWNQWLEVNSGTLASEVVGRIRAIDGVIYTETLVVRPTK